MSKATVEAWYNAERIDRLKLVAAYLFLNGLAFLAVGLSAAAEVSLHGNRAAVNSLIPALIVAIGLTAVWFYSAWLLWHARKEGAYLVIMLTVLAVVRWLASPWDFVALIVDMIPAILVAMSWSALRSGSRPVSIRRRT